MSTPKSPALLMARGCGGHVARLRCACTKDRRGACREASCEIQCEEAGRFPPTRAIPTNPRRDGETELDALLRWNAEGQAAFAERRFVDAARAFAAVLASLEEGPEHREERQNAVLVSLTVYLEAIEALQADPAALRTTKGEALGVLHDYEDAFARAYGAEASTASEVADLAEQLRFATLEASTCTPGDGQ